MNDPFARTVLLVRNKLAKPAVEPYKSVCLQLPQPMVKTAVDTNPVETSTVYVPLLVMVTESAAVGTPLGDQFSGSNQFPPAVLVQFLTVALAEDDPKIKPSSRQKKTRVYRFMNGE